FPRVVLGRNDHDPSSAHPLADVVVSLADEVELDAAREERSEALPGLPAEVHERASRRGALSELVADRAAEPRPDGPVGIVDLVGKLDVATGPNGLPRVLVQPVPELGAKPLELEVATEPAFVPGFDQKRGEVDAVRARPRWPL